MTHGQSATRAERAARVRALVAAEYTRLAPTHGRGDRKRNIPRILGAHLKEIIEDLQPDGHETISTPHRSVEHLLVSHDGILCSCDNGRNGICKGLPEEWVLLGFELAALDYPIEEPADVAV